MLFTTSSLSKYRIVHRYCLRFFFPSGNTAAAAFNAVLGNLLGVIVTPALLLLLIGRRLDMAPSLLATFRKLGVKVRHYLRCRRKGCWQQFYHWRKGCWPQFDVKPVASALIHLYPCGVLDHGSTSPACSCETRDTQTRLSSFAVGPKKLSVVVSAGTQSAPFVPAPLPLTPQPPCERWFCLSRWVSSRASRPCASCMSTSQR